MKRAYTNATDVPIYKAPANGFQSSRQGNVGESDRKSYLIGPWLIRLEPFVRLLVGVQQWILRETEIHPWINPKTITTSIRGILRRSLRRQTRQGTSGKRSAGEVLEAS